VREDDPVSRLRARCPACRTLTAVALAPEYECHSCGRTYRAAVVRVEPAPPLELPWPDAGVADAGGLPARPIVLAEDHGAAAAAVGGVLVRLSQAGLDPSERDLPAALGGANGVYVLLDGAPPSDATRLLERVRDLSPVLGAGVRGLAADEATPLLQALGL
jgi:hypothetical protein